ncbi:MAG: hypothetical protein AMXMBFR59_33520 [Rhodanobacteraceae bacterium]
MQAGDAVAGKIDHVALVLEEIADVGGDIPVVFDHEYAHRASLTNSISERDAPESKTEEGRGGEKRLERPKDWPKEAPLGERTSLGPNSYCPDYRSLLVTT